jgi:hypothetical protein
LRIADDQGNNGLNPIQQHGGAASSCAACQESNPAGVSLLCISKLKEEEVVQRLLEMAEMYGMGGKDKKYGVGQGNVKSHSIQSLTEGG